jgi:Resolvase, N terminal domain
VYAVALDKLRKGSLIYDSIRWNWYEDLEECGIDFKSLTENIDTTSGGKLIFHIFGALAEFE